MQPSSPPFPPPQGLEERAREARARLLAHGPAATAGLLMAAPSASLASLAATSLGAGTASQGGGGEGGGGWGGGGATASQAREGPPLGLLRFEAVATLLA
jgi:hypothetical protein